VGGARGLPWLCELLPWVWAYTTPRPRPNHGPCQPGPVRPLPPSCRCRTLHLQPAAAASLGLFRGPRVPASGSRSSPSGWSGAGARFQPTLEGETAPQRVEAGEEEEEEGAECPSGLACARHTVAHHGQHEGGAGMQCVLQGASARNGVLSLLCSLLALCIICLMGPLPSLPSFSGCLVAA